MHQAGEEVSRRNGSRDEGGERRIAGLAALLADGERLRRQGRRGSRPHDRRHSDKDGVERRERQPRDEGALIHVADRAAELVGHDDQHEARRDDLRQSARGGDNAGSKTAVVAVAQHDRQRDQPHRDDRSGDDAGRCCEQRTDEHDRIGQPAAHPPEHLAGRLEQILGHAAALEDQPHEGEERDREQGVVAHDAEHPFRQSLQQLRFQQAEIDRDNAEKEAVCGQREGHRIADQQEDHQCAKHQRRHVGDQERAHC